MSGNGESSVSELSELLLGESNRLKVQEEQAQSATVIHAETGLFLKIALDMTWETREDIEKIVRDELEIGDLDSSLVRIANQETGGEVRSLEDVLDGICEMVALKSSPLGMQGVNQPAIVFPAEPGQIFAICQDLTDETEEEIEQIVRDQLNIGNIDSSVIEIQNPGTNGRTSSLAVVVDSLIKMRDGSTSENNIARAPTVATKRVA